MIFSLFRNGKETKHPDYFRLYLDHYNSDTLQLLVETVIWERFINRHLSCGGIINDKSKFIQEAISMGFSIQSVDR